MIRLYRILERKVGCGKAALYSLIFNMAIWFVTGTFGGIALALPFREIENIAYWGMNAGAFCSLTAGYVCGYIRLLKIDR